MKQTIYLLATTAMLFTTFSCKKIIDVKLNDSAQKVVIEGVITNAPPPYTVTVTKTANFSSDNNFTTINNAIIVINSGTIYDTLVQAAPGVYKTSKIIGLPGATYHIDVNIDGNHYMAQSTMPIPVNLDSVSIIKSTFGFEPKNRQLVPRYNDPASTANFYRFKQKVNNKYTDQLYVEDDILTNGQTNNKPLLTPVFPPQVGDSATVEMMCIDQPVYKYFYSLSQNSGNSQDEAATPANPITNFSGGCLGYFSAQTYQKVNVFVQ
ncbi:MAG: DUF4249 domain-containing protein [Chitinophagia bacterium]|nr:DUF4249 domain-containing protein [Chitinophagia bacterium]